MRSIRSGKRFDVALSFPGEYRGFIQVVAETLIQHLHQQQVFYDKWYEPELARPNLDTYLQAIYHDDAELIVVFLCAAYEQKEWCGLEWRAIRNLIKQKQDEAIMLIRFDQTVIPGLFSIDGYIDATNRKPEEIATLILQRLNLNHQPLPSSSSIKPSHTKAKTNHKLTVPPQLHTFSFQFIEIKNKKASPFLLGNKFDIYKQRRQAKYFIEELGGGIELEMVAIPQGKLLIGETTKSEKASNSSTESRREAFVNSFFMSKYTVTQAQWKAVSCLPPVDRPLAPSPSKLQKPDHPVESISWHEAVEFCQRLSRKSGRKYRLPTELEWEYACRAGTTTKFHFGDLIDAEFANFLNENSSRRSPCKGTTPVNHFEFPNSFGLYDMHGNVYEWCLNRWQQKINRLTNLDNFEENSNESSLRVVRGGSWRDQPSGCQSAYRSKRASEYKSDFIGFRVICSI
ncbi:SUMF1/EgtB/PvdO family nonheme iron enzyme [Pantanalinema rosaneae CENA516]|uniref:SUMF1/EgtB/PvdO family nonheme iron enzyme n=1 Tax=Pantanalinema rosaneae TaxID=1620701 RepID=UPI003D701078